VVEPTVVVPLGGVGSIRRSRCRVSDGVDPRDGVLMSSIAISDHQQGESCAFGISVVTYGCLRMSGVDLVGDSVRVDAWRDRLARVGRNSNAPNAWGSAMSQRRTETTHEARLAQAGHRLNLASGHNVGWTGAGPSLVAGRVRAVSSCVRRSIGQPDRVSSLVGRGRRAPRPVEPRLPARRLPTLAGLACSRRHALSVRSGQSVFPLPIAHPPRAS
jgi:hypothetical protein